MPLRPATRPYKPKKAEHVPTRFYDEEGNLIGSRLAQRMLRMGKKVLTKPPKRGK